MLMPCGWEAENGPAALGAVESGPGPGQSGIFRRGLGETSLLAASCGSGRTELFLISLYFLQTLKAISSVHISNPH